MVVTDTFYGGSSLYLQLDKYLEVGFRLNPLPYIRTSRRIFKKRLYLKDSPIVVQGERTCKKFGNVEFLSDLAIFIFYFIFPFSLIRFDLRPAISVIRIDGRSSPSCSKEWFGVEF